MKLLVLLPAFYLLHVEVQNDLARQKLKGRVRSLTSCQCPVNSDGRIDSGGCMIYVFRYGDNGNQSEDNSYTGGNLYKGFGELKHKHLYKYDTDGRQAEVDEYNPDGRLNQHVVYKYDQKGNRVERDNYTPGGALWYRSEFEYDDQGNRVGCSKYGGDSVLLEHYTYAYDTKGNMVMEQHVVARAEKSNNKAAGRNDGYSPASAERMLNYVKTYTYDEEGKMTGEMDNVSKFSYPFESSYRYEGYDAAGNWLKQISMENGKPTSITERIIDYY